MPSSLASAWTLDPSVTFLNHGSFGATPRGVLEFQQELRARMEREPVLFLARELDDRLDEARIALADFLRADPDGLAFVPNVTAAANAVLRSLEFHPGDELLVTDQEYGACRNALEFVAGRSGAKVVVAPVPFPIDSPDRVVEALLDRVTAKTRFLLVDQVTSQTGLVFPVERIVAEMNARGIDTFVDGAHAPGMVDLDVRRIGASWYGGNCHKWLCAPKGAGFLATRADSREGIHPTSISHGWGRGEVGGRSPFRLEFDWTGTTDPTPWLSVPEAIRVVAGLVSGGWPEVRRRNRELALAGRKLLSERLGLPIPAPDSMIGSLAALPLPDGPKDAPASSLYVDPLHLALFERYRIEVPIIPWPAPPARLLRIALALYNDLDDVRRLADALEELLGDGRR
jgi:isopenicillin-N epimerase